MTLQAQPTHDREMAELGPWFHNLHLPDGRQTAPDHPLGDFPAFKWRQLGPALPEDLSGWSALDIGCNAGFYAFELARRGAHVLAIDADEHYLRQARWARSRFGLDDRVELRQLQVYDLDRLGRRFDLVLFLGVLYHLRYPLLALDVVAERVGRLLVLQTLTAPGEEAVEPPADLGLDERARLREPGWPALAFVERSFEGDPTNWWVPNHACVEAMLRSSGLEVVARPGHELYVCRPRAGRQPVAELQAVRSAFHRKEEQMSGENRTTTDHDEIRRWAEGRGGRPAAVEGTGSGDDPGILRIAFPDRQQSDDESLEEISWNEWFEAFDRNGLALVYQEQTAEGQESRFNKLVSRESVKSERR